MSPKIRRKKTGGRQKGTPNKVTASVRDALACSFEELGGVAYLVKIGRSDPKTYCALLAKLLPTQIAGDPENPLEQVTRVELVAGEILRELDGLTSGIPPNH